MSLLLGVSVCYGQTEDSAALKPGLLKRLRQLRQQRVERLQERVELQQAEQERLNSRPLLAADGPRKWNLSFNAPGLLELQMAVGFGVGYQISRRWQAWVESSYVGRGRAFSLRASSGGSSSIITK